MTVSEKIDYLYDKFVNSNGAQTSVFNNQIWSQGDQIPSVIPEFDSSGEYKNSSGQVILKRYEYEKLSPIFGYKNAFSSDIVSDIVSYDNGFDKSYHYKFYSKSNTGSYIEIPFGINGYFFDHDSGILFFPDDITITINPLNLYVTFIKYEGLKGIDVSSQRSSNPQNGSTGPTGATGATGDTGPIKDYSIRYKSTWSSSVTYSKWDLVKYSNKFYLSTIDSNNLTPGTVGWQPFGTPQLSSGFDFPDNTYWVSPSFTATSTCFSTINEVLDDINSGSLTDVSVIVYPGDYEIPSSVSVKPGVNINFIFKGRVRISFQSDGYKIVFSGGSRINFEGDDYRFMNGEIDLISSNLISNGAVLSSVNLYTNDLSNVSRLSLRNSIIDNIGNYASFTEITESNITNKLTVDDASVTHIFSSLFSARSLDELTQEKIEIINSIIPSGFGLSHPCLLIKNSRILSNGAVLYSEDNPSTSFRICAINSSLYVKDASVSFLDFSDAFSCFILNCLINTTYDNTKIQILNVTDPVFFKYTDAIFND